MKFTHENDFNGLINIAAAKYNVDQSIIKGIIAQESNFVWGPYPKAYRFEPYLSPKTGKPRAWLGPSADFPQGGNASVGLMQVLIATARQMGFTGTRDDLYDPATNLDYGTRFLSNLISSYTKQGKPLDNALSAYNGGSTGDVAAFGPFANQDYVNAVKGYISYFQSAGSDAETVYSTGDISGGSDSSAAEINLSTGLPYSADDLPTTTETASAAGLLIAGAVGLFFLMKAKSH